MRAWPAIVCAFTVLSVAAPVSAAQVCAWVDETAEPDDVHQLKLWLQSVSEVEGLYKIGGEGFVWDGGRAHSPGSGSFVLHPGQADSYWGFGSSLPPPGRIDVIVELHAPTPSIFDPPGPIMASYTFHREVPDGETKIPPVFAAKQCKTLVK